MVDRRKYYHYEPVPVTPEQAVEEKIKVLEDFCIVDSKNKAEIRGMLKAAIKNSPSPDFERVLDHEAKKLIERKLNGVR